MHYRLWERSTFWLPLSEDDFSTIKRDQELLEKQLKEDAECLAVEDADEEMISNPVIAEAEAQPYPKNGNGIHVLVNRVNQINR